MASGYQTLNQVWLFGVENLFVNVYYNFSNCIQIYKKRRNLLFKDKFKHQPTT